MKRTRSRHKSIDARTALLALIGLVFLGSGDMARGQGNPDPRITSINPNFAVAGGPAFTLTVMVRVFVRLVNGTAAPSCDGTTSNRTTSFVNSTQLTAMIPADRHMPQQGLQVLRCSIRRLGVAPRMR